MVVLVLFVVAFFQGSISYSISFGKLDNLIPAMSHGFLPVMALVIRACLLLIILGIVR